MLDDAWYVPASMNRVVVLGFEEDYHAIANSPGSLGSAATGNGYSRMANTAFFLAEFIRALGYRALPAGNGVGLSVPMAVDAGLGQQGRMGVLVTPKYGPRVRLAKVITDMPMSTDAPINFGVTEFCERCMLCAANCRPGRRRQRQGELARCGPNQEHGDAPLEGRWSVTYPSPDSSASSHALASNQSRFAVPRESWRTSAASSMVSPPK
jgi:reductive dehalogenase